MNFRTISLALSGGFMLLSFSSCLKIDDAQQKADEERKANEPIILNDYISTHNITVTPTASGLYYIESVAGTGDSTSLNTWIELKFTGRLVSNNQVVMTNDSLVAVSNSLYSSSGFYGVTRLILGQISYEGLNEGISMMREGGKARLIFPSSLGLGGQTAQNIPAYSSLIFDVELVKVIRDIKSYENSKMRMFLESDSISTDSTSSGIYMKMTIEGTGNLPVNGDRVTVNYKGKFMNGRVFDAGTNPFSLTIGNGESIPGFEAGVKLIKQGGAAIVVIPYYYAYGEFGRVDSYYRTLIPPFTTLVFEINVTSITK